MRTTRALIAGLGSSTSLVAASLCIFIVASAVVAFDGGVRGSLADRVGSLFVGDGGSEAASPTTPAAGATTAAAGADAAARARSAAEAAAVARARARRQAQARRLAPRQLTTERRAPRRDLAGVAGHHHTAAVRRPEWAGAGPHQADGRHAAERDQRRW
jgi:hypothetical protein